MEDCFFGYTPAAYPVYSFADTLFKTCPSGAAW